MSAKESQSGLKTEFSLNGKEATTAGNAVSDSSPSNGKLASLTVGRIPTLSEPFFVSLRRGRFLLHSIHKETRKEKTKIKFENFRIFRLFLRKQECMNQKQKKGGSYVENIENRFILKNESCFDFLKNINSKSVNLVLIDPPYEVSRETNFQSGEEKGNDTDRFRVSMDFGNWDKNFSGLDIVIKESYRILKDGGTLICFYDLWKISTLKEYFENAKFKQIRFIEWIKTNPVPLNSKTNYLTNSREIAVLGVKKGKPVFNSEYDNGIYKYPICHDKGRFHPTQKPLALIEDLVQKHSNENDIVLDCFSGSGTTAVASLNLNRNFWGCELSPEYYEKSLKRLSPLIKKLEAFR